MDCPDPSAQTDEQPRADPGAEATPVAPVPGSLGARQLAEGATTNDGGLADGEGSALAEDGSVTISKATAGNVGPSGAEVGVADDAPESGVDGASGAPGCCRRGRRGGRDHSH